MDYYHNWHEEKRSAYLYTALANYENNVLHKQLFLDLALAAEKQALLWENKMRAEGLALPTAFRPDMRTNLVCWLVKCLGAENMHYILSAMKIRGMSLFTRYHNEHRHTTLNYASNLRAAIFGVNDGLISNVSLILGIAGASSNQHFIVLTGIAGLLAGAFSMGAGEYISVRSQREVFEYQIAIEKSELEEYPEEEMQELSLIYQARGIPKHEADSLAKVMINNPQTGLDALAREELGINPSDLVSPLGAMFSSFISFAFGALIPLVPFLLFKSQWNLLASICLTGIALFTIGAVLTLYTDRNPLVLGLRMLLVGSVAGSITYLIGKWVGNSA